MADNFDFLHHHRDLKHYEASAKNLEQLYGIGSYAAVLAEAPESDKRIVRFYPWGTKPVPTHRPAFAKLKKLADFYWFIEQVFSLSVG